MDSHELAQLLLERDPVEIGASIDVSTCDDDAGHRLFASTLLDVVVHAGEATLCFEECYHNEFDKTVTSKDITHD